MHVIKRYLKILVLCAIIPSIASGAELPEREKIIDFLKGYAIENTSESDAQLLTSWETTAHKRYTKISISVEEVKEIVVLLEQRISKNKIQYRILNSITYFSSLTPARVRSTVALLDYLVGTEEANKLIEKLQILCSFPLDLGLLLRKRIVFPSGKTPTLAIRQWLERSLLEGEEKGEEIIKETLKICLQAEFVPRARSPIVILSSKNCGSTLEKNR